VVDVRRHARVCGQYEVLAAVVVCGAPLMSREPRSTPAQGRHKPDTLEVESEFLFLGADVMPFETVKERGGGRDRGEREREREESSYVCCVTRETSNERRATAASSFRLVCAMDTTQARGNLHPPTQATSHKPKHLSRINIHLLYSFVMVGDIRREATDTTQSGIDRAGFTS